MFDTHTHLTHRAFRKDRLMTYERALDEGVTSIIEVSWDLSSAEDVIRFSEDHKNVWAAIGIHPHDSKDVPRNYLKVLEEFAGHPRVKAIGETGLDFYRDLSPRSTQRRTFIEHIELAELLNLPLIIHCRDALEELLTLIEEHGYHRGVFHSAAADDKQAKRIVDLGFYLGINGTLTYDGARCKSWLPKVPRERLLVETDCPYLAPQPYRRERNEPAYLKYVCEAIGKTLNTGTEEIETTTEGNGKKLFDI